MLRDRRGKSGERLAKLSKRGKTVEMIRLYIQDDGMGWPEMEEVRAVLARFHQRNLPFSRFSPTRLANRCGTKDDRRVEPSLDQKIGQHRGYRGFAVGSSHCDPTGAGHQPSEHLEIALRRDTQLSRPAALWVGLRDRVAIDQHV